MLFEPIANSLCNKYWVFGLHLKLQNWWTSLYTPIYASNLEILQCALSPPIQLFFMLKLTTILNLANFDLEFGVGHSLDYVDFLWTIHTYINKQMSLSMPKYHGYRLLVGVFPKKNPTLTAHVLSLTTHMIALPPLAP